MFRVLIWDYTGESAKWCERNLDKNEIQIIQTITPSELVLEILVQTDAWDWLLIFERNMRTTLNTSIKNLQLPPEKIIYALDSKSWLNHPKIAMILLKEGNVFYRRVLLNNINKYNDFCTCTVEGLSYIATSSDSFRMPHMFANQINYASRNMKEFQNLSKQYYSIDDSRGVFSRLRSEHRHNGALFYQRTRSEIKPACIRARHRKFQNAPPQHNP